MKKIDKGDEPTVLARWKARHPGKHYEDLDHLERTAIRQACASEQFYLCAYCCQSISGEASDTMNEHLQPRHLNRQLSLDFNNMVASCTHQGQCDDAHGHQTLALTPIMSECETELKFSISGRVAGITERAQETIRVLNLGDHERNNRSLIEKRKQLAHAMMLKNGVDPKSPLEDDELLQCVIDDLNSPENGKLQPFAPVVANILRGWLST